MRDEGQRPVALRDRGSRVLAGTVLLVSTALVAATLAVAPTSGYIQTVDDAVWTVGAFVFAATGWVIVRRHPSHRIGWAFLWIGLFFGLSSAGTSYGVMGVDRDLPLADVAAWSGAWTWAPPLGLTILVMATFPTGRATNRWVGGAAFLGASLAATIATVNAVVLWPLRSPELALPGAEDEFDTIATDLISALFPVLLLAAVVSLASLFLRFRRAVGVERQQLKWLGATAVVMGLGIIVGELLDGSDPVSQAADVLSAPAWLAVGAGVAVLRYRLFDIDRILSRTLGWAIVTAVLVGVYAASVVGLGGVARALTGSSSDLVVALSTLAVAAAFAPVRTRVQLLVDRRFNRARTDGLRAAEDFGRRLRDEVDLEAVVTDLRSTVVRTLEPAAVSVVAIRRG